MRVLPLGLGATAMPTPLSAGGPRPLRSWNNIGSEERLGEPTDPSSPAPSVVLALPQGVGRRIDFYVQGFVLDRDSLEGRAAVTNGVAVTLR